MTEFIKRDLSNENIVDLEEMETINFKMIEVIS
jgi:hypothetical protein